jgi:K+-transporting ATPase ATPase B chain
MSHKESYSLFNRKLAGKAAVDALRKMRPSAMARNPVMFVVLVGAVLTTVFMIANAIAGKSVLFELQICCWLYFTVIFANFAEALAEGHGKARAQSLRSSKEQIIARKLVGTKEEHVSAATLALGDRIVCETGDIIPGDGDVVEGIASVDESAVTGESAPVIRESGGDRSAVTAGTRVVSDRIVIRITSEQGKSFIDKMIALIEGASRRKTPNEIALSILLSALTIVFIFSVGSLCAFAWFSYAQAGTSAQSTITPAVIIALLVCLIPTTIGGLLSAIGISGMDRLLRKNVLAMSGRAVEAAGDVDVLLLDKTGTITLGNRMASDLIPASGVPIERLARAAQLSSIPDETPEGRSVVIYVKEKFGLRSENISDAILHHAVFIPFSASTRMSGIDVPSENGEIQNIRKGAAEAIRVYVESLGGRYPDSVREIAESIARKGGTPIVVSEGKDVLGVIFLKDIVKGGIKERFTRLRTMGIRTVMITGDNPLTAAAIAAEAGVDDFIAEATPETKLSRIRQEQSKGRLVAMIGDGTNDAPALAQADVGVAMNTGTQTAREAGNMIDLDSNPTKLIEIVETGKQLLMTRGALTTFSIANDISKFFAIIPALFFGLYAPASGVGPLASLNIMGLHSPQSAIMSAVIFNALIIVALIPLALRGVSYKPRGANAVLMRNAAIYGFGGLVIPFAGIKLIDIIITFTGIVS